MSDLKVIAREVKTAPNSLNLQGQPRKMAVLTLSKPTVILAVDPVTGEEYQRVSAPLTAKVTQFLEEGTSTSGRKLGIDPFGEVTIGQRIPGEILKLGAADGIDPYLNEAKDNEANPYKTITQVFLGENIDQDSDAFEAQVQKVVDNHNSRMLAAHRCAAVLVP